MYIYTKNNKTVKKYLLKIISYYKNNNIGIDKHKKYNNTKI